MNPSYIPPYGMTSERFAPIPELRALDLAPYPPSMPIAPPTWAEAVGTTVRNVPPIMRAGSIPGAINLMDSS
jgi:hypothetical protein